MKKYQFQWRAMAGFQLCWFLLVYFQHSAILPVLGYWIFALLRLTTHRHRLMVLLIMLCGLVIDAVLVSTSVFKFSGHVLYPPWFVMLWAIFALAAVEFMADLLVNPRLAILFGAVGGPLSYASGAALSDGAFQPGSGWWWLMLALIWAVIAVALGQSRSWYENT